MSLFDWRTLIFTVIFLLMATGLVTLLFSRSTYAKIKAIPYAFVYGFGIVMWLASLVYAQFVANTFLAHRFSFTAAYLFTFGMLGLALTFPNNPLGKRAKQLLGLNIFAGLVLIGLIFFTSNVLAAANFAAGKTAPISPLGKVYLLLLVVNLVSAIVVFVRRYLLEVRNRLYFNYVVLSFILLFLIAITTNLILPLTGTVTLALIGPLSALLPFVAVVYALGITDINDIGYIVAQLVQVGGRLAAMGGIILAGALLHRAFGLGYYSSVWLISVGIVGGAATVAFYLFGSLFDTYIENKVAYSRLSPDQARSRLIVGLSGEIELDRNVLLVLRLVKQSIGARSVGIVLQAKSGTYWSYGDLTLTQADMADVLKSISELPGRRRSDQALVHVGLLSSDTKPALERQGVHAVKPLRTESGIAGLYLLGEKYSQEVFTKQDAQLMRAITEISDLSIERALFYNQIQAFNATLQERVDTATRRLRDANTRLKTLDAMKDDFISMASHQLRSPATSVHEAIQMLAQGYVPDEERSKILELAEASSERLVGVITDMLSLARIQAGHFTLDKIHVNMVDLVNRAVLEASGLAKQQKVTLAFVPPERPVELRADRAKLNEIISNYIENAIRYSGEGSTTTITLQHDDHKVVFEVSDTGIGVPESERKNLFKKFYRTTNARKEQPNGNGIGLFVVKTVAEAHGGKAYYRPRKKGSVFGFWIPD